MQTLSHFVAAVLGFFSGVPQPCIRAEMSRLVNNEEQGIATYQFALFKYSLSYKCQRVVPLLWQPNANLYDTKKCFAF